MATVVLTVYRGDHRRIYSGGSYSVERRTDGRTLIYVYEQEVASANPQTVHALEDDETIYVTTPLAAGRAPTIEVIRPQNHRTAGLRGAR
jgi:hypothetical protein